MLIELSADDLKFLDICIRAAEELPVDPRRDMMDKLKKPAFTKEENGLIQFGLGNLCRGRAYEDSQLERLAARFVPITEESPCS